MIKLAILGGSFDPIHKGHLFLLHEAIKNIGIKKIIIIPNRISNFKQDFKAGATTNQRLEMVQLALSEYSNLYPADKDVDIVIDTCELDRKGISYTYDTVLEIKERYKIKDKIGIIIGDDIVPSLSKWYKFEELCNLVEFFICRRLEKEPDYCLLPKNVIYTKMKFSGELFKGSSSEFRISGDNILTKKVEEYVRENNLYNK